jgi:hypothetical protein
LKLSTKPAINNPYKSSITSAFQNLLVNPYRKLDTEKAEAEKAKT